LEQIMSMRIALAAAAVAALAGCSHPASQSSAPQVSEKSFKITPDSIKVKSGIVGGELSGVTITEEVEDGTGHVDSGPRLSGHLVLRNLSPNQSVRIDGGKLLFADAAGKPIALAPGTTPPSIGLGDSDGTSPARLDPGQDLQREIDVDFPGAALAPGKLKEIHVQLDYTASPFKRDLLEFPVSVSKKAG
jgi:hypothetical protein